MTAYRKGAAARWATRFARETGGQLQCAYCNVPLHPRATTRDHDVPLSRGGDWSRTNLVPACHACNHKKANMTGAEFHEWLRTPAGATWLATRDTIAPRRRRRRPVPAWLPWWKW